ncbi:hypothetical protein D3C75_885250 [compost metagenome]
MARLRLAEQQRIQGRGPPRQPQRHAAADQQQRPQPRITGTVEAPEVPERQGAQGGIVGQVAEQTDAGAGQRTQGDAGQQHGRHAGLAVASAQPVDQRGHPETAGEGAGRQQPGQQPGRRAAEQGAADNRQRRAQRRAAGHPHQPRIGQRVAEQALHGHPAQRQHRAHHQGEQRPRQTDLADDQLGLP